MAGLQNKILAALAVTAVAGVMGGLASDPAQAQEFPTRTVTMVMPFPPGGSSDILGRLMQQGMSEALGQPVVIENRPGAAGSNGTDWVSRADPDGYTILLSPMAPITINPVILTDVTYNSVEDLTPIARVANNIIALAVHPDLGVDTLEEFIEHVRANPDTISYGSSGVASGHHIAGEMFNQAAGLDMEHIPYAGDIQAATDLVAGHLQVTFGTLPVLLPHKDEGLKILALAENSRLDSMPDVPAMTETITMDIKDRWIGLFAPAGTPEDVIARLNEAAMAALNDPQVIAEMEAVGLIPNTGSAEELREQVIEEAAYWGETLPALGIQP